MSATLAPAARASIMDNSMLAHRLETAINERHVCRDDLLNAVLEVVDPIVADLVQALRGLLAEAAAELEQRQTSGNDEGWHELEERVSAAHDALAGFAGAA